MRALAEAKGELLAAEVRRMWWGGELVHGYPPIHPQSTVWIWGNRRVMNDLFLHCGIEPTNILQICDGYGDNLMDIYSQ